MEHKTEVIAFGPFRLLPIQKQLWKDDERIEVRPMPLAVLAYLAQHSEQVTFHQPLVVHVRQGVNGIPHCRSLELPGQAQ